MADTEPGYCQVCNDRTGNEHHVGLTARDGTINEVELRLCEACSNALDAQDWITLEGSRQPITENTLEDND
jgi:hypothetical protein